VSHNAITTLHYTTQAASAEVWRQKETERANHLESALEEATATVAQLKSQLTNSSGSLDTAVAPLRKQKLELELALTEAQRKVQVLELEVQRVEVKHKADLSALQIEVASKVRNNSSVVIVLVRKVVVAHTRGLLYASCDASQKLLLLPGNLC
jgi:predicted  nucleic acid-binding Zn-ribbon protein